MSIIEGNFYSYDFVYGQSTLHQGHHQYSFQSNTLELPIIQKWISKYRNLLNSSNT